MGGGAGLATLSGGRYFRILLAATIFHVTIAVSFLSEVYGSGVTLLYRTSLLVNLSGLVSFCIYVLA